MSLSVGRTYQGLISKLLRGKSSPPLCQQTLTQDLFFLFQTNQRKIWKVKLVSMASLYFVNTRRNVKGEILVKSVKIFPCVRACRIVWNVTLNAAKDISLASADSKMAVPIINRGKPQETAWFQWKSKSVREGYSCTDPESPQSWKIIHINQEKEKNY